MRRSVWSGNIERRTIQNRAFRRVIKTGRNQQLVLMALPPGTDIGLEVHTTVDQFLRIERGQGVFSYGKTRTRLKHRRVSDGFAMFVPAGTWHNVRNASLFFPLHLYTLYAPPEHPPGTLLKNKPK